VCVLVKLTRRAQDALAATAAVPAWPVRRALQEVREALSEVDDAHVQTHLTEARDWLRAALRRASNKTKGEMQ